MHSKRLAALTAAGVLVMSGLATGTANASPARPNVTVADGCAPLSLNNPTRWGAQFSYRVVGNRAVGPVAVPARSVVQRELRPRYGSDALAVQWWARAHDWRAKAKAVRAAERVLTDARRAQMTAQGVFDAALGKVNAYKTANPSVDLPLTDAELKRLQERLAGDDMANDPVLKADVQARIAVLTPYLAAEIELGKAREVTSRAETKLSEARTAAYWTRWFRGVVRVPECVTSTPTPTPSVTVTEEPTETPTPDPTGTPTEEPEPEPQPTVTETTTEQRTIVIRDYLPVRVDTGLGGTAR